MTETRATLRRVYLSGPMTGYPDFNRAAFALAAEELRTVGIEPLNPGELFDDQEAPGWSDCMKAALRLLLDADAVLLLSGWEMSRGARTERWLAELLGMPVFEGLQELCGGLR